MQCEQEMEAECPDQRSHHHRAESCTLPHVVNISSINVHELLKKNKIYCFKRYTSIDNGEEGK